MSNDERTSLADYQRGAEPLISVYKQAVFAKSSLQIQRAAQPIPVCSGSERRNRLISILDEALKIVSEDDANNELWMVRRFSKEATASPQMERAARGA
mmetsp:Transcript_8276/g.9975  ORF Transcript_8276/g.9975 Transcript_8276/m.9975 type:complete len:98 (-) Transcript_8276:497-790(-)|eukprot:CAMPEP_0195255092 /NCGR_PEP_ID=MMETSP0706-20130129/5437_1 /TAXON_ID=33640 /ORGANISM="Asterionellopsis glacialis, Strain CCMP134" /LENGTH=97 /DNA_ID=CAMNT_0040307883 /DNA_START=96 /DNA_END=389 /DNA_ORIENTATION=-